MHQEKSRTYLVTILQRLNAQPIFSFLPPPGADVAKILLFLSLYKYFIHSHRALATALFLNILFPLLFIVIFLYVF